MRIAARETVEPYTTKDGSTIRELMHTALQSLAEATVGPGAATVRHCHRRSEELYVFLEGGGGLEVAGERRDVTAGDTALIPRGAWHAFVGGPAGARFLCCCAPPYSHEDTYLEARG
jgi:mannose-6-phosphate isomerase-like protein (cupin superfamily)